jgi:tyrosyl-tRNA synthetase
MPAFAIFQKAGLANSGGEARRLVRGGGARLNDKVIGDENQTIGSGDLSADGTLKLSAGKKRHVLIKAG